MADIFENYAERQSRLAAWDEMVSPRGEPRGSYRSLHAALGSFAPAELEQRSRSLSSAYLAQGVTFTLSGEERPFPLDPVPRVIAAREWDAVERGVAQRVRALEAFLTDAYGAGRVFADRVVPRRLLTSSRHFHRCAQGIVPHNGVRIHVAGIDLVRDATGQLRVLEDNLRSPSGVSYVIENRQAMARVFPEIFGRERVRPVADYSAQLHRALAAAAPPGRTDPVVVVLTPGIHNSAHFEHSLLARQMGVELVEGRDLVCRNGRVLLRTTRGEQRVDVVYRRIDDEYLDPLHFRPDSVLGVPGVLNAARQGNVTIANAVGNGVADDKLAYTYVPDLIRYYLAEEPILPNVDTYRLEEPAHLEYVLDNLASLVVKPVDGSGGYGIVIGPAASRAELARLHREIAATPRDWIAQPVVQLSTLPTLVNGAVVARHIDLRPFAVHDGDSVWVLPGGLTRVALPEGSLVVNSSQGGGSKDTWVLSGRPAQPRQAQSRPAAAIPAGRPPTQPPLPHPQGTPPLREQQQQQQQQQQQRQPARRTRTSPC